MRRSPLLLLAALVAVLLPRTAVAAQATQYDAPQTGWTSVYAQFPTTSYWEGHNLGHDRRAAVGYNNYSAPAVTARSYFQFDSGALQGKRVLNAQFTVWNSHSVSCAPSRVTLRGAGVITPTTTWSTQPPSQFLGDRFHSGGRPECGGTVPVAFDVTDYLSDLIAAGAPQVTFGLVAEEFTATAWRKFDTSASGVQPRLTVVHE